MATGKTRKTTKQRIVTRICSFRTSPETITRLEAVYDRIGITPAEQIRRAVHWWLKQQEAGR